MADETPVPDDATAPTPEAGAPDAPTPEAEAPTEPVAETPTEPPTEPGDPAGAASAPGPASATPPRDRPGIFVPRWVAILVGLVLAVGLVGGAGFWLGRETADDDDVPRTEAPARPLEPRQVPSNPQTPDRVPDLPDLPPVPQGRLLLGVAVEEGDGGAVVARVTSGSPADDAGLEVGDVITDVDGDAIDGPEDLVAAIRSHDPGDEITITYERDGETTTVRVTLADLSSEGSTTS